MRLNTPNLLLNVVLSLVIAWMAVTNHALAAGPLPPAPVALSAPLPPVTASLPPIPAATNPTPPRAHLRTYACWVATVVTTCDADTNEPLPAPHPQRHVLSAGWDFAMRQKWIAAHTQDDPAQQAAAAQAKRDKEGQ